MKTIITTVGTSLFENYMNSEIEDLLDKYTDISESFRELKEKRDSASEYEENGSHEKCIRNAIKDKWLNNVTKNSTNDWIPGDGLNEYASAEIESILKIQKDVKQKVQVYLICTDTVLSVLAAELIKEFFNCEDFGKNEYPNIEVKFEQSPEHIADKLRVSDNDEYQEGFMNMVRITNTLIDKRGKENCYINITGGYKAIIPVMTLVGQLKDVPLRYLYEDNEQSEKPLVKIGKMPVNFDWAKIEAFLQLLDDESLKKEQLLRDIVSEDIIEKLEEYSLIQKSQKKKTDYELTIIGELLKEIATSGNSPIGQDILGLYMEEKLRNFFNTNTFQGVQYKATSMDLFKSTDGKIITTERKDKRDVEIGDVDVVLEAEQQIIFCEVKSYGQTEKSNLEKITKRVDAYKGLKSVYPNQFWWFVQSVNIPVSKKIREANPYYNPPKWFESQNHSKVKVLEYYRDELKKTHSSIVFKAFVVELPLIKGDLKVNYMQLLKSKFQENDIIEIKIKK
jgi:putative CRISPR-associated protein (TIGR02619 family)